ncbi:hypothetical protein GCM10022280_09550 [Sphingomonas swuensis]|uniref:Uncharacterized protein n=1 Tax=Sphingomonas swuensis TaxID=977800 RepID=A0ABP7SLU7_9SPHN
MLTSEHNLLFKLGEHFVTAAVADPGKQSCLSAGLFKDAGKLTSELIKAVAVV